MTRYFFKVSRDRVTQQIKVSPVMAAPKQLRPYAMRNTRRGLVETCRVFSNKKEADAAHHDECFAAQLAGETPEALFKRMKDDLSYMNTTYHLQSKSLSALLGINTATLRAYKTRVAPPVRAIARISRLRQMLDIVSNYVKETLPDDQGTGNPAMGRAGNPDIWRFARRKQLERSESSAE